METCSICEEQFDVELEGTDIDDEYFCEDCRWEYTFTCPVCESYESEDRRGAIGSTLIVDSKVEAVGVPNGVYEIISHPYYGGPIIGPGGELFEWAVRRLGDLPTGKHEIEIGGYPCGHVCRYCDEAVKRRAILFQRF